MKLEQTTIILFLSKVFTSIAGFLGTVYFARVLGAEQLGVYFLATTVISWLVLFGTVSFRIPLKKRISESNRSGAFIVAGLIVALVSFAVLVVPLFIFKEYVNSYIGMDLVEYITLALLAMILYRYVAAVLQGQNKVHLFAYIRTANTGGRVVAQITAVFLSFGVVGLLIGYVAGLIFAVVLGIVLITVDIQSPEKEHFRGLLSYGKYSWAHSFQNRSFSNVDILILGFFVTSDLVGIYQVAWMIASFLVIFGSSIAQSLFPEMSKLSSEGDRQKVADLLHQSLTYTGLFIIPGLVGGVILGHDILRIYSDEFTAGTLVLSILLLSRLAYAYQTQLINTINAIDRPDLGFRINITLITVNVIFNVILIQLYGWVGAAVATTFSAVMALLLGIYYITNLMTVDWPVHKVSKQWLAALVMGCCIYPLQLISKNGPIGSPTINTIFLICVGSVVYAGVLAYLSEEFRIVVRNTIPLP